MKNLWFILVLFPVLASSQEVRVRRIEQITGPSSGDLAISAVSPDGRNILASTPDFRGLKIIDLRKKSIQDVATDAGAGYEPSFSSDGMKIFFRSDEFRDLRKYTALYEFDRPTGSRTLVEPAIRGLGAGVVSDGKLIYSAGGEQKSVVAGKDQPEKGYNNVYVILEDLVPFLCVNSTKKEFKPNGEGNYIWASLSPDRTKVLYNYRGTGTFVADTSGKILADLGRLNAPKWINDYLVAGMNDRDDGNMVTSSDICCYSLRTGKLYNLTNTPDEIEMYPWPVPGKKQVAFQSARGRIYLMNIRIR